ncbi:MAG: GIY-YIG nuclease family protein, partial [SAR202 cluster bacterium]|nr:GIY-YIG nuclease family protein [SAR202 cluster bacterium]
MTSIKQNQIKQIPTKPGVYFFKDVENEIIYIGKAKNLRNRVRSYFQKSK